VTAVFVKRPFWSCALRCLVVKNDDVWHECCEPSLGGVLWSESSASTTGSVPMTASSTDVVSLFGGIIYFLCSLGRIGRIDRRRRVAQLFRRVVFFYVGVPVFARSVCSFVCTHGVFSPV
jgi:hypothetical protein